MGWFLESKLLNAFTTNYKLKLNMCKNKNETNFLGTTKSPVSGCHAPLVSPLKMSLDTKVFQSFLASIIMISWKI